MTTRIQNELQSLQDKAWDIIRRFINDQPNRQYTWIMIGGRRLIFEKEHPSDLYSEIYVWHELREGEDKVREEDKIKLTTEELVEAASKLQKEVVAFEKELLYIDGEVKGHADVEPGQRERNKSWIEYELSKLRLQEDRIYELKMVRKPQVMTQAEAEVRKFSQIFQGDAHWNLKEAEEKFSWYWHWYGADSLDQWCWMREAE